MARAHLAGPAPGGTKTSRWSATQAKAAIDAKETGAAPTTSPSESASSGQEVRTKMTEDTGIVGAEATETANPNSPATLAQREATTIMREANPHTEVAGADAADACSTSAIRREIRATAEEQEEKTPTKKEEAAALEANPEAEPGMGQTTITKGAKRRTEVAGIAIVEATLAAELGTEAITTTRVEKVLIEAEETAEVVEANLGVEETTTTKAAKVRTGVVEAVAAGANLVAKETTITRVERVLIEVAEVAAVGTSRAAEPDTEAITTTTTKEVKVLIEAAEAVAVEAMEETGTTTTMRAEKARTEAEETAEVVGANPEVEETETTIMKAAKARTEVAAEATAAIETVDLNSPATPAQREATTIMREANLQLHIEVVEAAAVETTRVAELDMEAITTTRAEKVLIEVAEVVAVGTTLAAEPDTAATTTTTTKEGNPQLHTEAEEAVAAEALEETTTTRAAKVLIEVAEVAVVVNTLAAEVDMVVITITTRAEKVLIEVAEAVAAGANPEVEETTTMKAAKARTEVAAEATVASGAVDLNSPATPAQREAMTIMREANLQLHIEVVEVAAAEDIPAQARTKRARTRTNPRENKTEVAVAGDAAAAEDSHPATKKAARAVRKAAGKASLEEEAGEPGVPAVEEPLDLETMAKARTTRRPKERRPASRRPRRALAPAAEEAEEVGAGEAREEAPAQARLRTKTTATKRTKITMRLITLRETRTRAAKIKQQRSASTRTRRLRARTMIKPKIRVKTKVKIRVKIRLKPPKKPRTSEEVLTLCTECI